jgi:copper chaperone CopZ
MKLFNSQNLLSASLCSLLGLLTLFAGSYPLVKAQSEPKLGCQATVDKILQEIRSKGVRRVEFSVSKGTANQYRTGNPTNKTDVLDVVLIDDVGATTSNGIAISNIFASPKLLNNWANQIVKNCSNTAIVSFWISQSDISRNYYIQQDGTTIKEKCSQLDNTSEPIPWGYGTIPHCLTSENTK